MHNASTEIDCQHTIQSCLQRSYCIALYLLFGSKLVKLGFSRILDSLLIALLTVLTRSGITLLKVNRFG